MSSPRFCYNRGLFVRWLPLPVVMPYPEDLSEIREGELQVVLSVPDAWSVVMGASGKADREVHIDALEADGVPLLKRRGGGGTVLLGPNTLVICVRAWVPHLFRNLGYFAAINRALIDALTELIPCEFAQRGISDIAVDQRKVVGSSIFRRKHLLVYQASLLVDLDIARIDRYLKHPPKEPDYRLGRSHVEFVTSLRALGYRGRMDQIAGAMEQRLAPNIRRELGDLC